MKIYLCPKSIFHEAYCILKVLANGGLINLQLNKSKNSLYLATKRYSNLSRNSMKVKVCGIYLKDVIRIQYFAIAVFEIEDFEW